MQKIGAYTERSTAEGEFQPGIPGTGQKATPMRSGYFNMLQRELIGIVEHAGIELDTADDAQLLKAILQNGRQLGEPFPVWDHLAGVEPPSNSGSVQYIKLTAGEDGTGQYNEGLLTNETVSGSGSLIEITAEIVSGPMAGETVNLVNSENRYLMPGENSGTTANDQMQQITGNFDVRSFTGGNDNLIQESSGAISRSAAVDTSNTLGSSGNLAIEERISFDSANSTNARTGDHTNVKRAQATYYMRIA